jgi:TonB family protein
MRKFVFLLFTCLIVFGVVHLQEPDPTPAARRKLIEDCLTPDQPKPAVEKEMKSPELCGKAISLPKPAYPEEARAKGVSGIVRIEVVANEDGNVMWAKAVEGDPLLQQAALKAACQSKYSPEKISNRPIKVSHVISYNFLPK